MNAVQLAEVLRGDFNCVTGPARRYFEVRAPGEG